MKYHVLVVYRYYATRTFLLRKEVKMLSNLEYVNNMRDTFYNIFVLNQVNSNIVNNDKEPIINSNYITNSNPLELDFETDYVENDDNLLTPVTG